MSKAKKIQSPVLLIGDYYLCKNNLKAAKAKYPDAKWVTKNASEDSFDNIRMEAGSQGWDDDEQKILVIEDLPNRKAGREFLLSLASTSPDFTSILIWDSKNVIKVDPKTKTFNKTWNDFIAKFKAIQGAKLVNNGEQLNEKSAQDALSFVIKSFAQRKRTILDDVAKLFISIVGHDRGLLLSEIEKLCVTAPENIDADFILENAYPTSKESVLLKLAKAYNSCDYEQSLYATERFLDSGFNPNELAVVLLRQARWQMVAAYYWSTGLSWSAVAKKICNMGKFPAFIWHHPQNTDAMKKKQSDAYKDPETMLKYLTQENGIPSRCLRMRAVKGKKTAEGKNRAEAIPHPIVADETVRFMEQKIVRTNNTEGLSPQEVRDAVLDRAIRVYSFMLQKMIDIRYGETMNQDLQEMVRVITNTRLMLSPR